MKKEWISGKKGEKFNRTKSVDYLCEEMNDILARYPGFRMVNFGDAALNMESGWLSEFAEKWPVRVGLPFACNVNINYLDEHDIVNAEARRGACRCSSASSRAARTCASRSTRRATPTRWCTGSRRCSGSTS
jgi:hypothetical protein